MGVCMLVNVGVGESVDVGESVGCVLVRVLCENNRDRVWLGARGPQSSSPITVI